MTGTHANGYLSRMNRYTTAIVFRPKHEKAVRAAHEKLSFPAIIAPVNAAWAGLFPDDLVEDPKETTAWMKAASVDVPLLQYIDPDAEGWAFRAYAGGREIAVVEVAYKLGYDLVMARIEQDYPHLQDPEADLPPVVIEQLFADIRYTEAYSHEVRRMFLDANLDAVQKAFELPPDTADALSEIFSEDWYVYEHRRKEQHTQFLGLLGISDVAQMSFESLSEATNANDDEDVEDDEA